MLKAVRVDIILQAHINEQCIKRLPNLEIPHLIIHRAHLGAAHGRQVHQLLERQLPRRIARADGQMPRHVTGLAHGVEDRDGVAGRAVGAQADLDAAVQQLAHAAPPVRQARVAVGVVRDAHAPRRHDLHVPLAQVDAVRQDRARAEQPVRVVHVGVAGDVRVQGVHVAHFQRRFAHVRLHADRVAVAVAFAVAVVAQLAQAGHGLRRHVRAGAGLDARHDETAVRVDFADVGDDGALVLEHLLGAGLPVAVRAADEDAQLADDGALAEPQTRVGEHIRRGRVDARVVRHRRAAVLQLLGHHLAVHAVRFAHVRVRRLHRVRPVLAPLLQVPLHAQRHVGVLRRVHVRVDQAWEKELQRFERHGLGVFESFMFAACFRRAGDGAVEELDRAVRIDAQASAGQDLDLFQ